MVASCLTHPRELKPRTTFFFKKMSQSAPATTQMTPNAKRRPRGSITILWNQKLKSQILNRPWTMCRHLSQKCLTEWSLNQWRLLTHKKSILSSKPCTLLLRAPRLDSQMISCRKLPQRRRKIAATVRNVMSVGIVAETNRRKNQPWQSTNLRNLPPHCMQLNICWMMYSGTLPIRRYSRASKRTWHWSQLTRLRSYSSTSWSTKTMRKWHRGSRTLRIMSARYRIGPRSLKRN